MILVKVPTSLGALGEQGQEKAPDEIINQLNDIWSNEQGIKPSFEVEEIKITDDIEENYNILEKNFKENSIYIGGDHSITYGLVKGLAKKYENIGLISFDAHPDLYHHFDFPTHGDWIKFLIEENILKKENVILAGIRNADIKELNYIKENKIRVFSSNDIFRNIEEVTEAMMESMRKLDALYISVDIDVLDPSCAPGTSYLEPAGLTARELIYVLQRLKKLKNIKAVDITEVNPSLDINNITSKTASKIIMEMS